MTPMTATHYLACDLGAESGRVMLGTLAAGRLDLEEIHRFDNTPIKAGHSLHWNIAALFQELKTGLGKAGARRIPVASVSTDSWGVDYLLFDKAGTVISPTFHYRDPRTHQGVENALAKVPWEEIFAETGIQYMVLNTIFQLAAESVERLRSAHLLLSIGDGFNHLLGGQPVVEESMASTFQLYSPKSRTWSKTLFRKLEFPPGLFPKIVQSGTRIGHLNSATADDTGLRNVEVIASCSHDTGAAVAAVPASAGQWAYLSSGTWSLMGVELREPIITDRCRDLNFTNEIGYGGSVRLLKNIIGLWLVQECRRHWAHQGRSYDYAELTRLASETAPFVSLINPADERFLSPENMPQRIEVFCRETGQQVPETPGAMTRCILESLALLYRRTLLQIEGLTGKTIERLHIVGGGSKNELLNQFTANSLERTVLAGPVEATAAGNILIQAIALGHLPSLDSAREIVRNSMGLRMIEPQSGDPWREAYARFLRWFPS